MEVQREGGKKKGGEGATDKAGERSVALISRVARRFKFARQACAFNSSELEGLGGKFY